MTEVCDPSIFGQSYEDLEIALFEDDLEMRGMRLALASGLGRVNGGLTLAQYQEMCDVAGTPSTGSTVTPQGQELFREFGPQALPRIFPDIKRRHVAVEPDGLDLLGDEGFGDLPRQVRGVSLETIIQSFAGGMLRDPSASKRDRIGLAKGRCTEVAPRGLAILLDRAPELQGYVSPKQIYEAARQTTPGEEGYPGTWPLSYVHTIGRISYNGTDGRPLELLGDPTIAQVDRTGAYDLELTVVPKEMVDDYLRLRYCAYATSRVVNTGNIQR